MNLLPLDYWFTPELKEHLLELLEYPSEAPNLLCFFGEPGTGKTSIATHIAKSIPIESRTFNMDHRQNLGNRFIDEERGWFEGNSLASAIEENRPVKKVTILDEFHNLRFSEQDKFKTLFDRIPNSHWIIVCLNTRTGKQLSESLSPAVYSRLHTLDFNIRGHQIDGLVHQVIKEYSLLSEQEIRAWLPDFRKIQREGSLRSRRVNRQ